MSEQFEDIEDRIISGKGIYQFPTDEEYRWIRVYLRVIREPRVNFLNFKWNPNRSEYAKITEMVGEYVLRESTMNYKQEVREFPRYEPAAFLAPYLVCAFDNVVQFLVAIGTAVGLPPPVPGEPFVLEPVKSPVDTIRFACRGSTAIQILVQGLKDDQNCPGAEPSPKEPVPPPDELPEVPPDESIDVSPPYETPDDGGNTEPFEGDELPQPEPSTFRINTQGLAGDCSPIGNFTATITAFSLDWDEQTVPPGENFAGCQYDYLVVDGQSRFPDFREGSAPGTGFFELLDDQGNVLVTYPPGSPAP